MKTILFISVVILVLQMSFCSPAADGIFSEESVPESHDIVEREVEHKVENFQPNIQNVDVQEITVKLTPDNDILIKLSGNNAATATSIGDRGAAGGVVYTRWGKTVCREGADIVYEGYAGGNWYNYYGGAANYLCLPKDPEYISTAAPTLGSYIVGAEYQTDNKIFSGTTQDYNIPCVVCHVADKSTKLQLPAKTTCPESWTREYYGYLMTSHRGHAKNTVFECVDKDPDLIPRSQANTDGALFYFVEVQCGYGLPCDSPNSYIRRRATTCAICTK